VLARCPFDYVLGSVHTVGGYVLSSRRGASAWLARYGYDDCARRYCAAVAEAAASGLFDCMGHLEIYRRLLRAAQDPGPAGPSVQVLYESLLRQVAFRPVLRSFSSP